jgi:hypothetical protein
MPGASFQVDQNHCSISQKAAAFTGPQLSAISDDVSAYLDKRPKTRKRFPPKRLITPSGNQP